MIRCGWCDQPTIAERCTSCGRDASLPWLQRKLEPPKVEAKAGRPGLDESDIRKAWAAAQKAIKSEGRAVTLDAIAEKLDRSPRTIREWRVKYGLR